MWKLPEGWRRAPWSSSLPTGELESLPKTGRGCSDRFVRLEPSRSKPGNGLGLSLVAGVMKLHGGALLLEDNEPGLAPSWCFRFMAG